MGNHEARLVNLFQILSEELNDVQVSDGPRSFAVHRLEQRKKKRAALGKPGLDIIALENFTRVNDRVRDISINLDPFVEHNARLFITEAFERYNRRFDPTLIQVSYDHRQLDHHWRFGPGASNGIRGTHAAEKILQSMTCTVLAIPLVHRLRSSNVYFHTYDIGNGNDGTTVVDGSRLTTVPKNEETERTIAIEPSGNMCLQLAVGEYITDVLRSIGLDIRDQQPKNKALALRGSTDGSLATIDLTSASDMFSIELVRKLLPEGLFNAMLRLRSPVTDLPDGTRLTLNMMSTMGNGFTFPMMTMIFVALVYATRLKLGGPSRYIDWCDTGVFGDDIIVPTHESVLLIEVLEGCGFIVNRDKSYVSGPFRESCGGDYFLGYDVTPFYVKSLATNSDVYIAINKVFEWCAQHRLLLHRTLTLLRSFIDGEVYFVPEWEGDDSGFRTTLVEQRYKKLVPAMKTVRTKCAHFDMMLVAGGYVSPQGPDIVYTPRPFKTRYVVRKSRLPRGFLDGRCVLRRSDLVSSYVESYAFVIR